MTKGERTRQLIIEKAAPIINRKGMAGTSIQDIMAATNLTKGGIYVNFDSKEEICAEAFQYLCARLTEGITNAVAGASSGKMKLFALLDFYNDKLITEQGCPLLNFGSETDDVESRISEMVAEKVQVLQDKIADLVRMGMEEGDIRGDQDPRLLSLIIFSSLEGAILSSRIFKDKSHLQAVTDKLKADIELLKI